MLGTCGEWGSLLEDGPLPGEAPRAVGALGLAPLPAAGPLSPGSDRDIYNSQLCGPGPN